MNRFWLDISNQIPDHCLLFLDFPPRRQWNEHLLPLALRRVVFPLALGRDSAAMHQIRRQITEALMRPQAVVQTDDLLDIRLGFEFQNALGHLFGGEVGLVYGRAEVGYRIKGSTCLTNGQLSQKFMPIEPGPAADTGGTGVEFLADLNMGFTTRVVGLGDHSTESWCVDFLLYQSFTLFLFNFLFLCKAISGQSKRELVILQRGVC